MRIWGCLAGGLGKRSQPESAFGEGSWEVDLTAVGQGGVLWVDRGEGGFWELELGVSGVGSWEVSQGRAESGCLGGRFWWGQNPKRVWVVSPGVDGAGPWGKAGQSRLGTRSFTARPHATARGQ